MRIEEIETREEDARSDGAYVEKAAKIHHQRVKELGELQKQISKLQTGLGSAELDEAAHAGDEAERVQEGDRRFLAEAREELIRENARLLESCEHGLERSKRALVVNPLLQQLKGEGTQVLNDVLQSTLGVTLSTPRQIERDLAKTLEATKAHHERLEDVQKALLADRGHLDKIKLD